MKEKEESRQVGYFEVEGLGGCGPGLWALVGRLGKITASFGS